MNKEQVKKSERFLELHHSNKLLILPNIWDVLGAKIIEKQGFEAIATASSSVAYANGHSDGQEIKYSDLLNVLSRICSCTDLPVTADIEHGYCNTNEELADNIKLLIDSGVVGLNFEDSLIEGGELVAIEQQCDKIKVIRETSKKYGLHLVINARIDIFLASDYEGDKVDEAIKRGKSYINAGADCIFPILCNNTELIKIKSQLDCPINVFAKNDLLSMVELEKMGVARLSLGPSLLKSIVTRMIEIVDELKTYKGYDSFTNSSIITSSEIEKIIK